MLFRMLAREGFCSSVTGSLRRQVLVLVLQTGCVTESICFSTGSRPEEARSRMILIRDREQASAFSPLNLNTM